VHKTRGGSKYEAGEDEGLGEPSDIWGRKEKVAETEVEFSNLFADRKASTV
jgi:hypothetical protein